MKTHLKKNLNLNNKKFDHYLTKTIANLKRVFNSDKIEISFRRSSKDNIQTIIKVRQGRKLIQASGFGSGRIQSLCEARRNIKNKLSHRKFNKGLHNGIKNLQKNQASYKINRRNTFYENTSDYESWYIGRFGEAS